MLYYRSRSLGRDLTRSSFRLLTGAALALYPAGAIIANFARDKVAAAAGYALILGSVICVAAIMSASLQRIVGDQIQRLDEYELKLRSRATGSAYTCITSLTLLAIIYLALAADNGAWIPHTYGEFNGLFWGFFLYASVLPSVFLAWQIDENEARSSGDAA